MVVGAIAEAVLRRNDTQIVLTIVGLGVFAAAPLGEILVIGSSHDGRPACFARAMTVVVFRHRAAETMMSKPERVPHFVRDRFGHLLLIAIAQLPRKNETR